MRCESLRSTAMAADMLQKHRVSTVSIPPPKHANTRDVLLSQEKSYASNGSDNGAKKDVMKQV